jgi:hypothetical protein
MLVAGIERQLVGNEISKESAVQGRLRRGTMMMMNESFPPPLPP